MEKITVRKLNEVHVKLDCDSGTMMEVSDFFTFDVFKG